jgi:hypothetical protein
MNWPDAEDLLAGPRGRRLCWSLVDPGDHPGWDQVQDAAGAGDLSGLSGQLAACVAQTDLASIAAETGEMELLAAVSASVDAAMYWQEPDDEDLALAGQAVREALLPVARAVTAAPAARWWPAPAPRQLQQYVEWIDDYDHSPVLTGTAAELADWRSETIKDERAARKRPKDPSANYSGHWWSTPRPSRLPSTTRSIPGIGAVGLVLVEDSFDWIEARCWPVQAPPNVRIYEVTNAQDWAELVGRYPLDVSKSRRHDWWRVTGWAGSWLIPDFTAVASDYDAVHLTAAGYLTTAGWAVPVGEARTVLAGWNPDETYWLADVLTHAGPAAHWERQEDMLTWAMATPGTGPPNA